jgi:acyl-CoA thioester hydrolase
MRTMKEEGFGPVLFREECVFKRELLISDEISITAKVLKLREDGSRWTITHEFLKADGTLCATLTVDGAWMDVKTRRLADPTPKIALDVMNGFPKAEGFIAS